MALLQGASICTNIANASSLSYVGGGSISIDGYGGQPFLYTGERTEGLTDGQIFADSDSLLTAT